MKELINRGTKIHTDQVMRFALLILFVGISSCKSQKNDQTENLKNDLVLLTQDGYSAIETFETMIIRDQKTLQGFYGKINKTRKPGLAVPKVDFSEDMVVVVCMGEQLGDDLPDLTKKAENDQEITLQIGPLNSGKESHTTLISSPFCVYKMPIAEKEVVFLKN